MLVVTRSKSQTVSIGDNIKIMIVGVNGRKEVRLGISAPKDMPIVRDDMKLPKPIKNTDVVSDTDD